MAMRSGTSGAQPGSMLLVVHDFIARSPDELSLAKGDRIELIERDDEFGDGWFLGKHLTNGTSGLFPEVYTATAPKGTLTTTHRSRPSEASPSFTLNSIASAATPVHPASPPATTTPIQIRAASGSSLPSSVPQITALPTPPAAPGSARSFTVSSDSPVMSETLSVIDEHITDMRTPRSSYNNASKRDTIGSVYSTHPLVRRSYIAGHETDEEEQQSHTEDEVMDWDPNRVAEYLEDHGVEKPHCKVFKEQEITGEVLLAMDQNSLFIKEFELGPVGRRLKTWHKIKALQDEVKRAQESTKSPSDFSTGADTEEPGTEPMRTRSSTTGAINPRALSTTTKRSSADTVPRSNTLQAPPGSVMPMPTSKYDGFGVSPLQSMTTMSRPENTYRPSAQEIRNMNRSRRHSSIDSDAADNTSMTTHKKQPSLDKKWQSSQKPHSNSKHGHTTSTGSQFTNRTSTVPASGSPADADRGYFSSTEVDNRSRTRAVLSKRSSNAISALSGVSPMHSRSGSVMTNNRSSVHSRSFGSTDNVAEPVSPITSAAQQQGVSSTISSKFGTFRSATTPQVSSTTAPPTTSPTAPLVTKLEPYITAPSLSNTSPAQQTGGEKSSPATTSSPSSLGMGMFSSAKAKVTGLRSISDAVTKSEKDKTVSPTEKIPASEKDSMVSSPVQNGASTPSTENKSFDLNKPDAHRGSTGSGGGLMPPMPSTRRRPTRTKKSTSAYTRGLEKKPPAEQMQTCDYSGWMKKKSGSLMTTWKPRLFILRGRRLSYYYRDDDTEEKGLIDISFHRVLPAHNETLTGLHATVMGAGGSPTSPTAGSTPTLAQQDLMNNPPKGEEQDNSLFIFKLVPPRAGLAKGVSFTKPTVHYFAVNSRQEGRLWMAALMKATIDRDDDGVVTTTYNQKTISLQKARARHERPPALQEVDDDAEAHAELAGDESSDKGLGIAGLHEKDGSAAAGAEQPRSEDASSLFASTLATTNDESSILTGEEKEAVAMNTPG